MIFKKNGMSVCLVLSQRLSVLLCHTLFLCFSVILPVWFVLSYSMCVDLSYCVLCFLSYCVLCVLFSHIILSFLSYCLFVCFCHTVCLSCSVILSVCLFMSYCLLVFFCHTVLLIYTFILTCTACICFICNIGNLTWRPDGKCAKLQRENAQVMY